MLKKIYILLFVSILIISCGKKGDPEFKNPDQKARIQSTLINKA